MTKWYDIEDVKYYVEEAKNDLLKYGSAIFGDNWCSRAVVRLDDKIYLVQHPEDYNWETHEPKRHDLKDLGEDWDKALTELVIKEDGYKGDVGYHCDGYLYHDEAVELMKKGFMVKHERYNVTFKMVDGVICDHSYKDEPGEWYEFDLNTYDEYAEETL